MSSVATSLPEEDEEKPPKVSVKVASLWSS
jgi:hypothetical protein